MARLYGRRWDKARKLFLEQHPWCVMCEALSRMVRATVVDHIKPHREDPVLFWDETNWQSLCETHHNSVKQAVEKGRTVILHGVDGYPAVEVGPQGVTMLGVKKPDAKPSTCGRHVDKSQKWDEGAGSTLEPFPAETPTEPF